MLRRPPRLTPGSRVAAITPSSAVPEPSEMMRGIAALRDLGLEVEVMPNVGRVRGYLAGSDRRRAQDLMQAFCDDSFDAVWAVRGGYGAQRMVAQLSPQDLERLRAVEPKVVMGYSDITVIHSLVTELLGWCSFYGPNISGMGGLEEFGMEMLRRALFETEPWELGNAPDQRWMSAVVGGSATGPLAGGCLSLLANQVGTPLQVNFAGRIAFFEDVTEPVYGIDRYLTQLLAAGCFDGCLGIAIGDLTKITRPGNSLGLEHVFADLLGPLGVPCCHYFPFGHGDHQATIPLGVTATLDADRGTLSLTAGVS